jgi:hypothetical protein
MSDPNGRTHRRLTGLTTGLGLALAALLCPLPAGAGGPVAAPPPNLPASDAVTRIYLSQALSSLGRAYQMAQQASQYGAPKGFNMDRFLLELAAVTDGLQRYLLPQSPPPGPEVRVEITGQYLYEGLARSADVPPTAHPVRPQGGKP